MRYDLNYKLLEAVKGCDIREAEELLKRGADPLGSAGAADPNEHVLEELFCEMENYEHMAEMMPEFLKLFYKYGMDIGARKMTADEENGLNPLWTLSFCTTEAGLKTLHTILEHGIDCDSAEQFVDHVLVDMEMCDGCKIEDSWWMERTVTGLKMVMLVASYPEILNESPYIRECVGASENDSGEIKKFRRWNDFDYDIDVSTCTNISHGLCNATLRIRDKSTGEQVWKMYI